MCPGCPTFSIPIPIPRQTTQTQELYDPFASVSIFLNCDLYKKNIRKTRKKVVHNDLVLSYNKIRLF